MSPKRVTPAKPEERVAHLERLLTAEQTAKRAVERKRDALSLAYAEKGERTNKLIAAAKRVTEELAPRFRGCDCDEPPYKAGPGEEGDVQCENCTARDLLDELSAAIASAEGKS